VPLHHFIRERRARRIVEGSLAAAVALTVLVTPGLLHGGAHAGLASAANPSSTT